MLARPSGGSRCWSWLKIASCAAAVVAGGACTDRNGPASTPGVHRYVWDMRYADAHGIDGGTYLAGGNLRGPIAVPGTYQVRMKSGGQVMSQPLRILPDPRSQASASDLQEQFDLLIAIRDKLSAVDDAVNEIKRRRAEIAARRDRAAAMTLDTELEAILKELVELRFIGFDDQMLVFDLKVNNRIAALQGYVSQGDHAPTEQQYSVFRELSAAADSLLARLASLK